MVGVLQFKDAPRLSPSAISILKSTPSGPELFRRQFGDYYVGAAQLGAQTGVLLSQSSSAEETLESLDIKIKVQVLFFSKDYDHNSDEFSKASTNVFNISCFDTISKTYFGDHRVSAIEVGL